MIPPSVHEINLISPLVHFGHCPKRKRTRAAMMRLESPISFDLSFSIDSVNRMSKNLHHLHCCGYHQHCYCCCHCCCHQHCSMSSSLVDKRWEPLVLEVINQEQTTVVACYCSFCVFVCLWQWWWM